MIRSLLLCGALLLVLLAPAAAQAAEANDDFAAAAALTLGGAAVTGSTATATAEPGEPAHGDSGPDHSVWFRYTAATSRSVEVSSCGSDFDTLLAVYTGAAVDALTLVGRNDDAEDYCGVSSAVTFDAVAGTTYWIALDGYDGETGNYSVRLRAASVPNDDRSRARSLDESHPASGSTVDATKEPGEADHGGDPGGHSVWFNYYASTTAPVLVEACGSSFDTTLSVYEDSYGGGQEVASNDDTAGCGPGGKGSRVVFHPIAPGVFEIALDGHGGATGDYRISVLGNDDYQGARALYSGEVEHGYSNALATAQAGEPAHAGSPAAHSVWFTVPRGYPGAPVAGQQVTFDTCSTPIGGLDTVVAAYTLDAGGAPVELASSDDALGCGPGGRGSSVTFTLPSGPVAIAVDGKAGATGGFSVRLQAPPGNDDRAGAYQLYEFGDWQYGETTSATREPAEPDHAGVEGGRSVWYRLRTSATRTVLVDTCDSSFDTLLAVYTESYGGLQEVAANDDADGCDGGSRVSFVAQEDQTYHVAVDGRAGASGYFTLRTSTGAANDAFASAQSLSASGGGASGNTALATAEPGEPAHAGSAAAHSLWYRLTVSDTALRTAETCSSSSAPTRIAVYEGAALAALSPVASGGPVAGCASGRGARVQWRGGGGTRTYWIAVDAAGDSPAQFFLTTSQPPYNDDRAAAATLYDDFAQSGYNVNASHEADEPDHAGAGGTQSVWYRWQPNRSAPARVSTCGSTTSDTIVAVYTEGYGGLQEIGASDDAAGCGDGRQSRVDFAAQAGTTYLVAVDARTGGAGPFTISPQLRPTNDDRADAYTVPSGQSAAYGSLGLATKEAGEPDHAGLPGGHSIWYRWTAAGDGPVAFDTCGSFNGPLDTQLAVYTEGYGGLQEVASNDDAAGCGTGGKGSRVGFDAIGDRTYLIAVDAADGGSGTVVLGFPPYNDHFGGAPSYSGETISTGGDLQRATAEAGEPAHGGAAAVRSVWFEWTPPRSALATIETCGPSAARVAAYTGASVDALTAVTPRSSSACPAGQSGSRMRFDAVAGTTYRIAVDGGVGTASSFSFSARLAPRNDDLAGAEELGSTLATSRSASTLDAGRESGEPDHAGAGGGASVWYRWRAPRSGTVRVDTCDSGYDTALALYRQTGAGMAGLVAQATSDDSAECGAGGRSRVRTHVDEGSTYLIAVDGRAGAAGSVWLQLSMGPQNDDFASAYTLVTGTSHGVTYDAGPQPGEPNHADAGGDRSVWYVFSGSETRNAELRACPTSGSWGVSLAVYATTGAPGLGALTPIGTRSTQTVDGVTCQVVRLRRSSGERRVAVDGAGPGQEGGFSLSLTLSPVNDDRQDAIAVSGSGVTTHTNVAATSEDGEPQHAGTEGGRSVWWTWIPQATGPVTIETCDSSFDTLLAVYREDGTSAEASSDDAAGCGTGGSRVRFTAQAGTRYAIAVDGKGGAQGTVVLGFPPANDLFSQAATLWGDVTTEGGGTARAGDEPQEPAHAGQAPQRSVWYRWTPSHSGRSVISTCLESSAQTRLALYTGDELAALAPVAASGPVAGCAGGRGAKLTPRVVGGTEYRIAVDSAPAGSFSVQAALAPVNDDRADAAAVGARAVVFGSTAFATAEEGEGSRAGRPAAASVWYRVTPERDGSITVKTCGSAFATVLGVYGAGGEPIAASDDAPGVCADRAAVSFDATAGSDYLIAVDGRDGASGAFQLAVGSPVNDDFADATVLSGEHASGVADSTAATTQDGEPTDGSGGGRHSVWWRWTAPSSGPIEINTCGSSGYTVLSAYTGAGPGSLVHEGTNTYATGCESRSRLTLDARAGETYSFRVSAWGGMQELRLQLGPPANDRFAAAQTLTGHAADVTGTTAGAANEDGEIVHDGDGRRRTLWYAWAAPETGVVALDTCDSPTPAGIGAYRGNALHSLVRVDELTGSPTCDGGRTGRRMSFAVEEGLDYRIAVETTSEAIGPILLRLRLRGDVEPPETTITSGPDARTKEHEHRFEFESDEARSTFECRIDDEPFAPCFPAVTRSGLSEGAHAFEVRATDEALNTDPTPARRDFTIDRTPPEVALDEEPPAVGRQTAVSVAFSSPEAGAIFECALDGAAFAECASPAGFDGLADGTHQVRVRARDDLGNTGEPLTSSFRVDTRPPVTGISSGPDAVTAETAAEVAFAADEPDVTYLCTLDGLPLDPCGSPQQLTDLGEGEHVLGVMAIDAAGNVEVTPAERRWRVDLTPPETTASAAPDRPVRTAPSFTLDSSEAPVRFECAVDAGDYAPCASPFTPSGLADGEHTARMRAVDEAGNRDPTAAERSFVLDTVAPGATITDGPSGTVRSADVEVTFELDDVTARAECALDGGAWAACESPAAFNGLAEGDHHVDVRAVDPAGNEGAAATRAFTVLTNEPPAARLGLDVDHGVAALTVHADVEGTDAETPDGLTYSLSFGDGSAVQTGSLPRGPVAHTYTHAGTFLVRLTVSDGAKTAVDSHVVAVALDEPLKAAAGDDQHAVVAGAVTFDAAGSRPAAAIEEYRWDFGDGATATGPRVSHAFAQPGRYAVELTTISGDDRATDTAEVTVIAPPATPGLKVRVTGGGVPLIGATAMVVNPDGSKISAPTGATGEALLKGLRDGPVTVYAWGEGFRPKAVKAAVAGGEGEVVADLESGEAGAATLSQRRMTMEEILASGVDVADPDNYHVYEADIHLYFDEEKPVPLEVGVTREGVFCLNSCGGGGGGGGGAGWGLWGGGCSFVSTQARPCFGVGERQFIPQVSYVEGVPIIHWLVLPMRASFLKEFFDVQLVVQNLLDGFTFEPGVANLELPAGLSLAALERGQTLRQSVPAIAGGGSRTVTWIVRGDTEGYYDLAADYSSTIEPIGAPVYLRAQTREPLHVWAAGALKTRILADPEITRWGPYSVDIEITNTTNLSADPAPVYNLQVEMLDQKPGAPPEEARFFYAPQPDQVQGIAELGPGETHTFHYVLYAGIGREDVQRMHLILERSFVQRTGGDVDLRPTIGFREGGDGGFEPGGDVEARVNEAGDAVDLSWERPTIPEDRVRVGYQIFTRQTLGTGRWEYYKTVPGESATIPATAAAQGRYYAIGTQLLDGDVRFVHNIGIGPPRYVSLGDSFSSGEGVPEFEPGTQRDREIPATGNNCHRSWQGSYGRIIAADPSVDANLQPAAFHACSGAVTEDIWGDNPRNEGEGPQREHLNAFTNVVSLSMGGNDVGFRDIAALCALADCAKPIEAYGVIGSDDFFDGFADGFDRVRWLAGQVKAVRDDCTKPLAELDDLEKATCAYTLYKAADDVFNYNASRESTPRNLYNGVLEARLQNAYEGIAARAPNARVYVQLYPHITDTANPGATCRLLGSAPVTLVGNERASIANVINVLNGGVMTAVKRTNDYLRALGRPAQFKIVPNSRYFDDHGLCRNGEINPGTYFNTLTNPYLDAGNGYHPIAYSFHPNAKGQQAYANALRDAIAGDTSRAYFVQPREQVDGGEIFVPYGARTVHADSAWRGSTVTMSLVSPDGTVHTAETPGVRSGSTATTQWLEVDDPQPGTWRVKLFGDDVELGGEPTQVNAYADVPPPETPELTLHAVPVAGQDSTYDFTVDGPDGTYEWTFSDDSGAAGRTVRHGFTDEGHRSATVRLTTPDGVEAWESIQVASGPDTHPPDFTTSLEDRTLEATGPSGAVATFVPPSTFDDVDGAAAAVCSPASGTAFPVGRTTVRCTASDAAGNDAEATFAIDVTDTTAPGVPARPDLTAPATGRDGATVDYAPPHAQDLVDGDIVADCSPTPGSRFPIGATRVDCVAADAAGNRSSGHFTVTVSDTGEPVITVPGDITLEATSPAGAVVEYAASAADVESDIASFECVPASGSTLPLGETTIRCSAEDAHGNASEKSFRANVEDTKGPVLADVPANISVPATGASGAPVDYATPKATDAVDGQVAVTCGPPSGSTFSIGHHTVTCSAEDAAHNTSVATFSVDVLDGTAPVISAPADIAAEASDPTGAVVTYTASAADPEGGAVTFACEPASGTRFPIGTTTVRCEAVDGDGNSSEHSFKVTVRDSVAPVIRGVPGTVTTQATGADGAAVAYAPPAADDAVSGAVPVACAPASGSTFPVGTTTVTCSASDGAGNVGRASFAVVVTPLSQPPPPPKPTVQAPVILPGKKAPSVRCPGPGPSCSVILTVKSGKKQIGRTKATVRANGRKTLRIKLNARGKRLLSKRRRIKVSVALKVTRGALVTSRTLRLRLSR